MSCQQNLAPLIAAEANRQGVPQDIALAIARQEGSMCHWWSDGRVKVGSSGEVGVMQVKPTTAPGVNLYDVNENIRAGVGYLVLMFQMFGDWQLAAAAYNWGPGKMRDYLAGRRGLPAQVASYATGATAGQPTAGYSDVYPADVSNGTDLPNVSTDLLASVSNNPTPWAVGGLAALALLVAAA